MLKDIYKPKLLDILPQSVLADKKLRASAEALDFQLEKLSAATREVLHLPRIEELDHAVLDALAFELHCDFYEPTEMTLRQKRNLIRESVYWHRIKGTPAAVEKLLKAVFKDAQIEEWFEYENGRPGYFRIKSAGLLDFGDESASFLRMVNAAKNVRSWLDDILIDLTDPTDKIVLSHSIPVLDGGNSQMALDLDAPPPLKNFVGVIELATGSTAAYYDTTNLTETRTELFAGVLGLIGGEVIFGVDPAELNYTDAEEFESFLRERWRKFKDNPVIEFYHHHDSAWDGELDDDNPDETFPRDVDFLRLYFDFPVGRKRYITLFRPRDDVQGSEINALGKYSAENETLLNSRGCPTSGIIRALYITKTTEKIL